MYVCMYVCMYVHIYIYIYYRERYRELFVHRCCLDLQVPSYLHWIILRNSWKLARLPISRGCGVSLQTMYQNSIGRGMLPMKANASE